MDSMSKGQKGVSDMYTDLIKVRWQGLMLAVVERAVILNRESIKPLLVIMVSAHVFCH